MMQSKNPIKYHPYQYLGQFREWDNSAPTIQGRRFSDGQFSASQFSDGRFSASLNDFHFKKFRPFFKENYVFCSSTIGHT
ncbi:Hypothetical protein FKW44_007923 [Caligus rogercresseyi]|uniref:Uncharacterized protein n=1 Tax=Caligus rogercresseyi TaxID=217165 RepID=A0A7T8KFF1_CALRO|nr:Hypothetical protein FKW44_007923 [Caligus rogercresseyi]